MRKNISKFNGQKGFTLVETFVAITVLVIAVLGPMSLLSRALQDSRYIKDEIIASYLAQEGVELVMDERNNNPNSLVAEEKNSPPYSCGGLGTPFYLDEDVGYSCDQGGKKTIFSREVKIEPSGFGYRVTSTVRRSNLPNRDIVSSSLIFKY